jgi:hypothetical protein
MIHSELIFAADVIIRSRTLVWPAPSYQYGEIPLRGL